MDCFYRRCSLFWLVNVFKDPSLYILVVLMITIPVISPRISEKMGVANSAVTGIGSGMALFCFALVGIIGYLLV